MSYIVFLLQKKVKKMERNKLKLFFQMDLDDKISVQDYRGSENGLLSVVALPYSQDGTLLTDEDIEDPKELLLKNIQFMIDLKKLLDVPEKYVKVDVSSGFRANFLDFV